MQIAPHQSLCSQGLAGHADGGDLGVPRWVMPLAHAVAGLGDYLAIPRHDGAHGHLATGGGGASLVKGNVHHGRVAFLHTPLVATALRLR